MKHAVMALAAFVAFGLLSAPSAQADDVVGRVVYMMGFASDNNLVQATGGVLGLRADGTYWLVYTTSAISDAGANRILTAASATVRGATAYMYFVTSLGGGYLYTTNKDTELSLALPQQ